MISWKVILSVQNIIPIHPLGSVLTILDETRNWQFMDCHDDLFVRVLLYIIWELFYMNFCEYLLSTGHPLKLVKSCNIVSYCPNYLDCRSNRPFY